MSYEPPSQEELASFKALASLDDLAKFLGTIPERLSFHLYSAKRPPYNTFTIPKATGGERVIRSPPPKLASFQSKILRCMTASVTMRGPVHAFTLKKSVVSNAKPHVGARLILNIDLLDFFPNINFGRVRGVFSHGPFNFSMPVATLLAQICCHKRSLPQGAPTSPLISNLVCRSLDRDLIELARRNKCKYTRYADDITFSTNLSAFPVAIVAAYGVPSHPIPVLGDELAAVISVNDFKPNPKKIKIRARTQRQVVTGIVVNSKPNLRRSYIRNIRAILHNCKTQGLSLAEDEFKDFAERTKRRKSPSLADYLHGKLDYLRMVRGGEGDPLYSRYAIELEKIAPRRRSGVRLIGQAAHVPNLLAEAIWIVIGYDQDGYEFQGTGFNLAGVGIVTAHHVFDPGVPPESWKVISAASPRKTHAIKSKRSDQHIDMAILDTDAIPAASLSASASELAVRDEVSIVGFPNWHSADRLSIIDARVTQTKTVSGVSYFLTNGVIRGGNSGGPVLNRDGLVVGVALSDSSHLTAPDGGVVIRHLTDIPGST